MVAKNVTKTQYSNNDKLEYKGYIGKVKFDGDSNLLFGEVINTEAVITFVGETGDQVKESFIESIDAYLDFCKELGEDPEDPPKKTYSGKFTIRISPELHKGLSEKAKKLEISLNDFIIDAIKSKLRNN